MLSREKIAVAVGKLLENRIGVDVKERTLEGNVSFPSVSVCAVPEDELDILAVNATENPFQAILELPKPDFVRVLHSGMWVKELTMNMFCFNHACLLSEAIM